MNQTIETIMSHRSARAYRDEPVSDDVVAMLVSAGFAASTSSNIQAATVVRVRDPKIRVAIAAVAGQQMHVVASAVFLVWCADLHRGALACKLGGGKFEQGMTEHLLIATIDVALAAQNTAVAAESLGLGICYIGGIRNDPDAVSKLLELPNQVYPAFGMCIGWTDVEVDKKPRLSLEATLKEERYPAEDEEAQLRAYDEEMQAYYARRGTPGRSWIDEMAKLLGKESRAHMRKFLDERGLGTR